MYKLFFLLSLILITGFTSACNNSQPRPPKTQYIEFSNYNEEVLPKLSEGYSVVKHDAPYIGPRNITRDEILTTAKRLRANLVMVDSEFGIYNNTFDIVYLRKLRNNRLKFGATFIEMPLHIRQNLNSNIGCTIDQVYYGTPAYLNDIHHHDVITKVNGQEITSCRKLTSILKKNPKWLYLTIWADNKTYRIEMDLN